jgi:hypothetical protein
MEKLDPHLSGGHMHKYDKRFTGGNQIAYEPRGKFSWERRIQWDWEGECFAWRNIRHKLRELSQEPDEDVWDSVIADCNHQKRHIEYY